MRAFERFQNYVKVDTKSDPASGKSPSNHDEWEMARVLSAEFGEMGMPEVALSGNCILMGRIPATPGYESAPVIGFLAHMDTSPDFSGRFIRPVVHPDYDGGDIALPKEGRVIRAAEFPFLAGLKGKTVVTADGSTLLGADDKAGIAEIMTMCQRLLAGEVPHGEVHVAFTPDEEIGEGADHFDVGFFGAKYAYTVDGGAAGEIEYENFNAASARLEITGVSVHPGSAKGVMENALLIAQQFNALLPPDAIPGRTEGYEGFFHLTALRGTAASATAEYIIRDHDRGLFEEKKALMTRAAAQVQGEHPTARVELEIQDSYYNMREKIEPCMHLIENAQRAAELAGLEPRIVAIRGGTDGARLSYMGLPCPNLGTGGYNFHGPMECLCLEDMDKVVDMLCHIVELYADRREGER